MATKLLIIFLKSWFLFLLVWPFSFLLTLLSDPWMALVFVFFLNALLAGYSIVALSQSETGLSDKALAIPLFPSVAMSTTLIAYYIGAINASVFVVVCAIAGVVIIEGIVLLSVLMGNSKRIGVQQAMTTIGILSPILMSIVWIISSSGISFKYGCLISVTASFCNVLFNKSSLSVGFPQLPVDKRSHYQRRSRSRQ
uniref:Uncharacterized protein n=1 Tax=Spongospora subterranea TaxID=70186 RepID=A0A0H5QI52_9EUKA|eukprot:CRZ01671.1 hypothetical protein [Spongospora subterranea]